MSEKIAVVSLFVLWITFCCTTGYLLGNQSLLTIKNSNHILVIDSVLQYDGSIARRAHYIIDGAHDITLKGNYSDGNVTGKKQY